MKRSRHDLDSLSAAALAKAEAHQLFGEGLPNLRDELNTFLAAQPVWEYDLRKDFRNTARNDNLKLYKMLVNSSLILF